MITNIDFLVKIDHFVYIQSNLCALIFHQKYHKLKNRLYQQLWASANISNKHYSWRNKAVSHQALPYQTLYQTAQAECSNCVQLVPA